MCSLVKNCLQQANASCKHKHVHALFKNWLKNMMQSSKCCYGLQIQSKMFDLQWIHLTTVHDFFRVLGKSRPWWVGIVLVVTSGPITNYRPVITWFLYTSLKASSMLASSGTCCSAGSWVYATYLRFIQIHQYAMKISRRKNKAWLYRTD